MSARKESRKGYTDSEDSVILRYIQEFPVNLSYAFEEAAKDLGRTVSSVSGRYYTYLKNNTQVIAVASSKGVSLNNNKVVRRNTKSDEFSEDEMIELMHGMFQKLSTLKRKEAVKLFLRL